VIACAREFWICWSLWFRKQGKDEYSEVHGYENSSIWIEQYLIRKSEMFFKYKSTVEKKA